MVAWLDRPADRTKDLGDIALVLKLALPDDDDRRWDVGPISTSGFTFELQSAYCVGLSVGEVARELHLVQVERFLGLLLAEDGYYSAQMAKAAGHPRLDGDDRVRAMLGAFQAGVAAALRHRGAALEI